jgi:hypothetical protein
MSLFLTGCMGRNALPGSGVQARRKATQGRSVPDGNGSADFAGRGTSRNGGAGFSPAPSFSPAGYGEPVFTEANPMIPGIPERGYSPRFSASNNAMRSTVQNIEPEGERVIYDPRVDGMPQPNIPFAFSPSQHPQSPQSSARRGASVSMPSSFPSSRPFAGASVGRSNAASARSMQAKQAMQAMDQEEAAARSGRAAPRPNDMAASTPAPVPKMPVRDIGRDEDMRLDQEVRAKAAAAEARRFSAMAAPSGEGRRSLPRADVAVPAKPEQSVAQRVEPARKPEPAAAREQVQHDEVFTPDLFLSGD